MIPAGCHVECFQRIKIDHGFPFVELYCPSLERNERRTTIDHLDDQRSTNTDLSDRDDPIPHRVMFPFTYISIVNI